MQTLIRKLTSSILILLGVIAMAGAAGCGGGGADDGTVLAPSKVV